MAVSLSELCLHHPLLSILNVEQNLEQNESLQAYVMLLISSRQVVPATMTELYSGYVNYVMKRSYSKEGTAEGEAPVKQGELFVRYGQVAFDIEVKKKKITREMLEKQYNLSLPVTNTEVNEDVGGKRASDGSCCMSFAGTHGLLMKDGDGRKCSVQFKDGVIRSYLAAHYQLSEVLRKIRTKRKKLLSSTLIESVRRLPASGDLWRMTLGLMALNPEARKKQRQLMMELLDYSKTLITMSSYDMTSLCVESIYESRFASSVSSKTLDDFTLNQTINFSKVKVKPHRLNYTIAAVGHLVRTNGEIFGLHLSTFGISESNIHLLTDPLNIVSDNSLQVLNLSGNELGEGGILKLERFLVKASLLTHLDLSACLLYDAGAIHLSDVLICLQLIYLNLADNGITDRGMADVIGKLRFCPALEFLHLANNRLTDRSAILLGGVMHALPNLRSLDLRQNEIGEEGVQNISENTRQLRPMSGVECNSSSVRSDSVWKTRSARIANFSLRKVPMGGVLKRSNHGDRAANESSTHHQGKNSSVLPGVEEETSDGEARQRTEEQQEKSEGKRVKFRAQRMRQIERSLARKSQHSDG